MIIFVVSLLRVRFNDGNRHLPIAIHVTSFSLNLLLAYHLMDKEARRVAQRYLLALFRIEERTLVIELVESSWSCEDIGEQMSETTEVETTIGISPRNSSPKTTCFSISPI